MKKLLIWAGIALVALAIVKRPAQMSHVVQAIGTGLGTVADSFGIFLGHLI